MKYFSNFICPRCHYSFQKKSTGYSELICPECNVLFFQNSEFQEPFFSLFSLPIWNQQFFTIEYLDEEPYSVLLKGKLDTDSGIVFQERSSKPFYRMIIILGIMLVVIPFAWISEKTSIFIEIVLFCYLIFSYFYYSQKEFSIYDQLTGFSYGVFKKSKLSHQYTFFNEFERKTPISISTSFRKTFLKTKLSTSAIAKVSLITKERKINSDRNLLGLLSLGFIFLFAIKDYFSKPIELSNDSIIQINNEKSIPFEYSYSPYKFWEYLLPVNMTNEDKFCITFLTILYDKETSS